MKVVRAMRQGCPLSESEIQKIVSQLKHTAMPMSDIAATVGCTRRSVYEINKKYNIRKKANDQREAAAASPGFS